MQRKILSMNNKQKRCNSDDPQKIEIAYDGYYRVGIEILIGLPEK